MEKEKTSDPDVRFKPMTFGTHHCCSINCELQGQIGAGCGKLRWQFAANEHLSVGVTSKVWWLSTIENI